MKQMLMKNESRCEDDNWMCWCLSIQAAAELFKTLWRWNLHFFQEYQLSNILQRKFLAIKIYLALFEWILIETHFNKLLTLWNWTQHLWKKTWIENIGCKQDRELQRENISLLQSKFVNCNWSHRGVRERHEHKVSQVSPSRASFYSLPQDRPFSRRLVLSRSDPSKPLSGRFHAPQLVPN